MKYRTVLLALFSLIFLVSCTPIVESMLLKRSDARIDQIQPDEIDVINDSMDIPVDFPPDSADVPLEEIDFNVVPACLQMDSVNIECSPYDECQNGEMPGCGEKCDQFNDAQNGDGCDPRCYFKTQICTWVTPFSMPADIVIHDQNAYVVDSGDCSIKKIVMTSNEVTIIAGVPGVCDCNEDPPDGKLAQFKNPSGIEELQDYIFVVDTGNHIIRKIDLATSTNMVTRVAGKRLYGDETGACIDGAQFHDPTGIAADAASLFIADTGNRKIKRIINPVDPASCYVEEIPVAYMMLSPRAIAWHQMHPDHIFVADALDHTILRIEIATGITNVIAGDPGSVGHTDVGIGLNAKFNSPMGLDLNGHVLIVADMGNHALREIELFPFPCDGCAPCTECRVTKLAGQWSRPGCIDTVGTGTGSAAQLNSPKCVAFNKVDPLGPYKFFFCDECSSSRGGPAIRIGK